MITSGRRRVNTSVLEHADPPLQVRVDGKFFRRGEAKFHPRGFCYGPFAPGAPEPFFASAEQTTADFRRMRELGANLVRVYRVPSQWWLELAAQHELQVLVDVPWERNRCFLASPRSRQAARQAVVAAAKALRDHPSVFALSVVNEIPPDIARWSGPKAVAGFLDELVDAVKQKDPERLCTFGNYPPTEFLRPRAPDFHCFNVYLHHPRPFGKYLDRLQMLCGGKPLLLGEVGMDTLREGESAQAEFFGWQIEIAFRKGLAGIVLFSFTDEWFTDDGPMTDWRFGVTTVERQPKPAAEVVRARFAAAPCFPLSRAPKVSVVVAGFNAARTLHACLESLERLHYPDYEVIFVDDGSTDETAAIASAFPRVRVHRHTENLGLSVARNTGIELAQGEIIAFTDADCRADEDWLHYLVQDLLQSDGVGIGGPNLFPPDDSPVAAAVLVSPGGPTHVMLTDRVAEHLPGCNMAFFKWALEAIGGFDPQFRRAGDDVDVCWRLQHCGYRLEFSPAAFVWHYRRSTIADYLRQQQGYGEAEALLIRKHPECFNWLGGSLWQGRIYAPAPSSLAMGRAIIYHGRFGSGFFQSLYRPPPAHALLLATTLEFHAVITLPLLLGGALFPFLLPLGLASLLFSLGVSSVAAWRADLPPQKKRFWSRPLIGLLFTLQPLVRGWARYQSRLRRAQRLPLPEDDLESLNWKFRGQPLNELTFQDQTGLDRVAFLTHILRKLDACGWPHRPDTGWNIFDGEVFGSAWSRLQFTVAAEVLGPKFRIFRCRLKTAWTFRASLLFWSLLALELLLADRLASRFPGAWFLLVSLPVYVGWLRRQGRKLQRQFARFLHRLADDLQLTALKIER